MSGWILLSFNYIAVKNNNNNNNKNVTRWRDSRTAKKQGRDDHINS